MHHTYIIYSLAIDRYYIGSTSDSIENRLRKHIYNKKGYTARATDWQLVYKKTFNTVQEARAYEKTIKAWKSRKRIESLIEG